MPEGRPIFHPHLSADGTWRWDGHAWVPVTAAESEPEPAPAPTSAPAPEAETAAASHAAQAETAENPEGESATHETEAAPRHGWLTIGALIAISLVVIAALIGAAMLAYRAAGSPPPNAVVTPSAHPVNPNSLNYRYLAGVTVGALTTPLEQDGFSCAAPAPPENHLRNSRCDRTRGTQRDIVQVWAVDPDHVQLVEVTTVAASGPLDTAGAQQAIGQVAPLVYPGSAADAAAALAWAGANSTTDATTTVGGVTLRTQHSDVATLLDFDAGPRH